MGDLCQCFPECANDPDVDPRTVADGGEGRHQLEKILCNINLIAIILGIVLFFTQIRLPVILGNTMSQISATLGPDCSLVISREVFFVSEGHRKPETYRANLCDQHKFCASRSVLLARSEQ